MRVIVNCFGIGITLTPLVVQSQLEVIMAMRSYTAILEKDGEVYVALCPEFGRGQCRWQMARFNFFRDEAYFGKPRQMGTSHLIFNTPWQGDPRINIQEDKGKAKAYQVRQVLLAIDKLEGMKNER